MSLEVPRVDDGGREVLELYRGLVAEEEIHAACSDGERQAPSAPVLDPLEGPPTPPSQPPRHTQVLPELRLDSDLQQLVLKQDPVVLAHEPGGGGGGVQLRVRALRAWAPLLDPRPLTPAGAHSPP